MLFVISKSHIFLTSQERLRDVLEHCHAVQLLKEDQLDRRKV
jgi:hypothetical protein